MRWEADLLPSKNATRASVLALNRVAMRSLDKLGAL
jgi:hypothetical protein